MLFAQPSFGRYTVFGHHFALENGVVHRLDRQPTMSRPPLHPDGRIGPRPPSRPPDIAADLLLPLTSYGQPIEDALSGASGAAVVLDALDDSHLALIGAALLEVARERHPLFALGSGGLQPRPRARDGLRAAGRQRRALRPGFPCSSSREQVSATRRQVAAARPRAGSSVRSDSVPTRSSRSSRGTQCRPHTSDETAFASESRTRSSAIAEDAGIRRRRRGTGGVTHRIIVCGGDTSVRVAR